MLIRLENSQQLCAVHYPKITLFDRIAKLSKNFICCLEIDPIAIRNIGTANIYGILNLEEVQKIINIKSQVTVTEIKNKTETQFVCCIILSM